MATIKKKMGDMGDTFNALKEESRNRRKRYRDYAPGILTDAGVNFKIFNAGAHIIIMSKDSRPIIDFWPGTGLFINRKTRVRGRGIKNLIKLIED